MFKRVFLTSLLFFIGFVGCNKLDDDFPPKDPTVAFVEISAQNMYGVANDINVINFDIKIYDSKNSIIKSTYDLLVNGTPYSSTNKFKTSSPGIYQIQVKSGEILSNVLEVEMREAVEFKIETRFIIFHIVHDGEEIGEGYNISSERIDYQMNLLNKTFEQNNHLTPNSYLSNIKFKLATIDPEGNNLQEAGINRVQRPNVNSKILFEEWMWKHYWDPDFYINVWIGDTGNGYSWGIYPSTQCGEETIEGIDCTDNEEPDHRIEGIALELDNLYNENWVFPHEMGHLFGLFHIFSGDICNADVDFCPDTLQYNRTLYESNNTNNKRISCNNKNFISYNIMDYWNQPNGLRDLTYDQIKRIRFIVNHGKWRGAKTFADGTPRNMYDLRKGN